MTSPIPMMITQSQTKTAYNNLPHFVPSHGSVEMMNYRRYLLEDIIMAPLGESTTLLVSTKHPWYPSHKSIADHSSPLPLATIRDEPFVQVKATVAVNCQLSNLKNMET
jgi:hypothetical protein